MLLLSLKEKIILGSLACLIVIIPVTSYIISFRFKAQTESQASTLDLSNHQSVTEDKSTKLLSDINSILGEKGQDTTTKTTNSLETSFGPTLSFLINLEGRPPKNQAAKVFLGIALGAVSDKPQYLLSFKVDMPSSGQYSNLSLAGLNSGTTYTAFLKGPGQIATSSAFIAGVANTELGLQSMLSGDLNEDNIINNDDLKIAQAAYGARANSSNWNPYADFNADGVINNFDLAYIYKNNGKVGAGGPWYSQVSYRPNAPEVGPSAIGSASAQLFIPSSATSSASPTPSSSGGNSSGGYWLWVPTN